MLKTIAPALIAVGLAGDAIAQTAPAAVPASVRAELAPTGKLRGGMNLSNTLFITKDAATGELRGVAVDLMRELAASLGVPVEFVIHATPGDVADAAGKGTWDVAILAIEPARAQTIVFSSAITEIEASYVVHNDSPVARGRGCRCCGCPHRRAEARGVRALSHAHAAQCDTSARRNREGSVGRCSTTGAPMCSRVSSRTCSSRWTSCPTRECSTAGSRR